MFKLSHTLLLISFCLSIPLVAGNCSSAPKKKSKATQTAIERIAPAPAARRRTQTSRTTSSRRTNPKTYVRSNASVEDSNPDERDRLPHYIADPDSIHLSDASQSITSECTNV